MPGSDSASGAGSKAALLVDFGGVLTTSIFESFSGIAAGRRLDPALVEQLIREEEEVASALAEHEVRGAPLEEFERVLSRRLREHGVEVPESGLVAAMIARIGPDRRMLAMLEEARQSGVRTAIVSNTLGYEVYDAFEVESLVDEVVLSGRVGIRKPDVRIYEIACKRLGVSPAQAVMIDDLELNLIGSDQIGIKGILHRRTETTIPRVRHLFELDGRPA